MLTHASDNIVRKVLDYSENSIETLPSNYESLQSMKLNLNPISIFDAINTSDVGSQISFQAFSQRSKFEFNLSLNLMKFDSSSSRDAMTRNARSNHSQLGNFSQQSEFDFSLSFNSSIVDFDILSQQTMRSDGFQEATSQAFAQRSKFNFDLPVNAYKFNMSDLPSKTLRSNANIAHFSSLNFMKRPVCTFNPIAPSLEVSHAFSSFSQRSEFDFNLSANVPDLKFINLLTNDTLNTSSTSQSALPQVSVQRPESHQAVRNETLQSYTQMSEHDSRMSLNASRLVSIEAAEQSVSNDSIHRLMNLEYERSSRVSTIMKHCRDGRISLQAASQYVMRKIM